MAHLEANNILSPTEDQLALLAQEIENAFQEKKKTVAVFYDLSKAWSMKRRITPRVPQAGVSGRMYKWIRCFHEMSARVKVDGHHSDSI